MAEAREQLESFFNPKSVAIVGATIRIGPGTFCLSMFDDAVKTLGYEDKLRVKDISELVAESLM